MIIIINGNDWAWNDKEMGGIRMVDTRHSNGKWRNERWIGSKIVLMDSDVSYLDIS